MIEEKEIDSRYYGGRIRVVSFRQNPEQDTKGDRSATLVLNDQEVGWIPAIWIGSAWMAFYASRQKQKRRPLTEAEAREFVASGKLPLGINVPKPKTWLVG